MNFYQQDNTRKKAEFDKQVRESSKLQQERIITKNAETIQNIDIVLKRLGNQLDSLATFNFFLREPLKVNSATIYQERAVVQLQQAKKNLNRAIRVLEI